jgi:hypothetical protein
MITEEQRNEVFKEAAQRRRENGIKLGRFLVTGNSQTIGTLIDMFEEWKTYLGSDGALKLLQQQMIRASEGLRVAVEEQNKRRK